jgi:hypothetical protein
MTLTRTLLSLLVLIPPGLAQDKVAPRTSLDNPTVRYSAGARPYVVIRRGDVEIVVVDNQAVDDEVLPGHRAGYSGLASIRHARQPRNLFVPAYAGLNFEHVVDGSLQDRKILFEPRQVPMELRVIDDHTAELYQRPTPHYGVESCHRFQLLDDSTIEMTFECIPRRKTWVHDYLLFFWASYIDQPESLDVQFLGLSRGESGEAHWIRGVTPEHGVDAVHPSVRDERLLPHVDPFPLPLAFGFSPHRYAEPWYFGACRGMTFAQIFREQDRIRMTQSPSGGGTGCPAWDFQWIVRDCQVDQRYQMVMRVAYSPVPDGASEASLRDQVQSRIRNLRIGDDD